MNEIDEKIDEVITKIKSIRIEIGDKDVVNTFEKTILNAQIPKLSYWFAVNIKGADLPAHKNVIINSGDSYWIKKFKDDIEGTPNIKYLKKHFLYNPLIIKFM